jgi:hypothetical protein
VVGDGRLWLSEPLGDRAFRDYRQSAIFEGAKWDIQIHDHCALSRQALVISGTEWQEVSSAAVALAAELRLAEQALLAGIRGGRVPGLDRASRRWLAKVAGTTLPDVPRLVRFDFHLTASGWVISEGNCDVPGGINEASHLAASWPGAKFGRSAGDPAGAYAAAIARASGGRPVALVHATSFSDDWQLLKYLADALARRGVASVPADPGAIAWRDGKAEHGGTRLGAIMRFFPGDWLIRTGFAGAWFAASETPVFNPVTSLVVQNKRFPILCKRLGLPLPTFARFLPAVEPVRLRGLFDAARVVKPAYGRVGEGVGVTGVTAPHRLRKIRLMAALFPRAWLLQERFETAEAGSAEAPAYPCLGVYTLGTEVVGAYGRLSPTPVTDLHALDAPVFIAGEESHGRHRMLQQMGGRA